MRRYLILSLILLSCLDVFGGPTLRNILLNDEKIVDFETVFFEDDVLTIQVSDAIYGWEIVLNSEDATPIFTSDEVTTSFTFEINNLKNRKLNKCYKSGDATPYCKIIIRIYDQTTDADEIASENNSSGRTTYICDEKIIYADVFPSPPVITHAYVDEVWEDIDSLYEDPYQTIMYVSFRCDNFDGKRCYYHHFGVCMTWNDYPAFPNNGAISSITAEPVELEYANDTGEWSYSVSPVYWGEFFQLHVYTDFGIGVSQHYLTTDYFSLDSQQKISDFLSDCHSPESDSYELEISNERIKLIGESRNVASLTIFDISGRLIHNQNHDAEINISNLNAGCYILNIVEKNSRTKTTKFIR